MNGSMDSDITKADEAERYVNKLLLNLNVCSFPDTAEAKGAIRLAVAMNFFTLDQGTALANQADAIAKNRRQELRLEAHRRHVARGGK